MTSRRTEAKKANRWPYWSRRVSDGQTSAAAAVATQWDLARTYIHKVALFDERDRLWRALALTVAAFNTRFTGEPAPEAVGFEATDTAGRNADAERFVKAAVIAVAAATSAYDTARKYLSRIDDAAAQEQHWRDLEDVLRTFNQRFDRDPTRAIARMASSTTRHN